MSKLYYSPCFSYPCFYTQPPIGYGGGNNPGMMRQQTGQFEPNPYGGGGGGGGPPPSHPYGGGGGGGGGAPPPNPYSQFDPNQHQQSFAQQQGMQRQQTMNGPPGGMQRQPTFDQGE